MFSKRCFHYLKIVDWGDCKLALHVHSKCHEMPVQLYIGCSKILKADSYGSLSIEFNSSRHGVQYVSNLLRFMLF